LGPLAVWNGPGYRSRILRDSAEERAHRHSMVYNPALYASTGSVGDPMAVYGDAVYAPRTRPPPPSAPVAAAQSPPRGFFRRPASRTRRHTRAHGVASRRARPPRGVAGGPRCCCTTRRLREPPARSAESADGSGSACARAREERAWHPPSRARRAALQAQGGAQAVRDDWRRQTCGVRALRRMGGRKWPNGYLTVDVAVPPRDVRAEGCSFLMRAGTETSGILAPSSCRPATATVVPLATLRRPRCKIPSNEAGMRACDVLRAMLSGLLHCTIRFLTQVAHLSLRRRRLCDCDRPRVLCTCDVLLFRSSASCVLSLANFLRGGCECTSYLCISSPVLFCVVCPHGICPGLRQGGREYGYAPQQGGMEYGYAPQQGGMEYGYAPQQGYGRGPPEEAQRCFAMCTRGYANYSIHTHIYPGMCFRAWTWVFRTCSMSSTTRDGERTCMHFAPTGRCSSPRTALRAAIMLR